MTWIVGGVFVIAVAAALRAMSSVAIPVVFATLITFVLAPLHARLATALPSALRWVSHVLVMLLVMTVIVGMVAALVFAAERVLQEVPSVGQIQQILQPGPDSDTALNGQLKDIWNTISSAFSGWMVDQVTTIARAIAGMTGIFISTLVIVFFLILLALTESDTWRGKVKTLWPEQGQTVWVETLSTIAYSLRKFLLIRSGIGLLQALLYVLWLWLFGVDLLVVWAVLTFVLTYIPNLGSVIAGTLPVLYALITKDWGTALGVAAGLLVIEQVVGNFIDPKILGKYVLLSPVVILVSLLFWGWLWGVAGAFLATPIMLSLLVTFNHIASLRPLALLLSNQRTDKDLDHALDRS
ncbi:AI-2E family transporter [Marivita sp. S0852]|uniref:AI-2E family transporter n=1 Tax=Marivita sp. S0852 TaxID=3373893 RepID=UPI003982D389